MEERVTHEVRVSIYMFLETITAFLPLKQMVNRVARSSNESLKCEHYVTFQLLWQLKVTDQVPILDLPFKELITAGGCTLGITRFHSA
jgi:hypothetical protein